MSSISFEHWSKILEQAWQSSQTPFVDRYKSLLSQNKGIYSEDVVKLAASKDKIYACFLDNSKRNAFYKDPERKLASLEALTDQEAKTLTSHYMIGRINSLDICIISETFSKTINNNFVISYDFHKHHFLPDQDCNFYTRLKMYDDVIGTLSHIAEKRKKITAIEEIIFFIKSIWKGINFVQTFLLFFYKIPDKEKLKIWMMGGTSVYAQKIVNVYKKIRVDLIASRVKACEEKIAVLTALKSMDDETLMNWQEKASWYSGCYSIPEQSNPLCRQGKPLFETAEEIRANLSEKIDLFQKEINNMQL